MINEAAMMRRMTKRQGNGRVAGGEENASDRKEEHLFGSGSPFPAWWYSAHTMYGRRHVSPARIKVFVWVPVKRGRSSDQG